MKKAFHHVGRDHFWEDYWKKVGHDVDRISDANCYPLSPIDRYVTKESRILEAGCGLGRVLKHYYYQGFRIQGIEYSTFCLDRLRREDPDLPVLHGSLTALPYRNHSFDIVMAFGVIGHLETAMECAFREVHRVLRPRGLFAGSLYLRNLGRGILALTNRLRYDRDTRHFYTWLFTRREIKEALDRYDFELLHLSPVTTRSHLFAVPFFRKGKSRRDFTYAAARDAERAYQLNFLGRFTYFVIRRLFPWNLAFAASFVAEKR